VPLPHPFVTLAINQTVMDGEGARDYEALHDFVRELGIRHQVVIAYRESATSSMKVVEDAPPRAPGVFETWCELPADTASTLLEDAQRDTADLPWPLRWAKRYYLEGMRNRLALQRAVPNPRCVALNSWGIAPRAPVQGGLCVTASQEGHF
jgi:hypothetical protein